MHVQALGYVGVRCKSLEDWASYGQNFLGLQRIDKSRASHGVPHGRPQAAPRRRCRWRAGHRLLRLGGGGRGRRSMRSAAKLESARHQGGARLPRARRRAACEGPDRASDPVGNRLEFFHGAETASDPFKPGRNISGFRTGPLGMGHVVMHFERHRRGDAVLPRPARLQAQRLLIAAVPGYFFHVNPRHHSFAMMETGKNAVHHMMVELYSFDDMGQGYDLALGEPDKIAITLGRHSGDYMTSFYTYTRRASWSSTAGAASASTTPPGSRSSASSARACGATTATG